MGRLPSLGVNSVDALTCTAQMYSALDVETEGLGIAFSIVGRCDREDAARRVCDLCSRELASCTRARPTRP